MVNKIINNIKLVESKKSAIKIDNVVFKLHYRLTVVILLSSAFLVTARQYFGDPIDCLVQGVPQTIMDSHCWIRSTFTVPYSPSQKIGKDIAHPGVANYYGKEDGIKYHTYYQWVCFVLFFQAGLFYTPHYLWKTWEGEQMKNLINDLTCPLIINNVLNKRIYFVTNYFSTNKERFRFYFYRFLFCELLNLMNCLLQIFALDLFLNGEFTGFGINFISFINDYMGEKLDPLSSVFPKVTKCTFYKYGPSGTLQKIDGLCILPLNIVNEKIYILLWFWYYVLTIITVLWLAIEIIILANSKVRYSLLKANAKGTKKEIVISIVNDFKIGEWFFLYQIVNNLESAKAQLLMEKLQIELLNKQLR